MISARKTPSTSSGQARRAPTLFEQIGVPARAGCQPQIDGAKAVAARAGAQALAIARALASDGDLTREEICVITRIPTSSACGRLWEMEFPDEKRPSLLAREPVVCKAPYRLKARSGVKVSVYRLTPAGRSLVAAKIRQERAAQGVRR